MSMAQNYGCVYDCSFKLIFEQEMVGSLRWILPANQSKDCLPEPTVLEIQASVHGVKAVAETAFSHGATYFLHGKVRSDSIEVRVLAQKKRK